MLTIYKSPRKRFDSSSDSDSSTAIIPAGRPYLTKVNGKLVLAREKRERLADVVVDILGEAFGSNKPKVIHHQRRRSLEAPAQPLLIGGVPYVPQQQPQQVTYSTPLPQQPFPQYLPPSPNGVIPLPQQHPAQLQYPNQPQAYVVPPPALSPTEKDFEQLKLINSHFESMHVKSSASVGSDKQEAGANTTVTIAKHVCAQCGRLRSRKFHHDNPIKVGETPTPAYCRKCQRDASSTSGGESDRESKKPKNKRANKKEKEKNKGKRSKQKLVEDSDEDGNDESKGGDDEHSPASKIKNPKSSKATAKAYKRVSSEDYIVVEEEDSEVEQRPRGRGRTRVQERVVVEEYIHRRPTSPLQSQITTRTQSPSRSTTKGQRFNSPKRPIQTHKAKASRDSSQPPIKYRHVKGVPSQEFVNLYPKKVPIHFEDEEEVFYNSKAQGKTPKGDIRYPARSHPSEEYIVEVIEELEPDGRISSEDYRRFRNTGVGSHHTSHSQERRKQENISLRGHHEEAVHDTHPRCSDDPAFVTEFYEYRPQNHKVYEEERRVQERLDRDILRVRGDTRSQYGVYDKGDSKHFKEDAAHRYYHEDWSLGETDIKPHRRGYRRERHQGSDISESEASLLRDRNGICNAQYPRVPSPPSVVDNRGPTQPPYPLSSDSEKQIPGGKPRIPTVNRESSGEQSLVLSSRGYSRHSYGYDEGSDLRRREIDAEEEARKHVSFRDTPSERSVSSDGWRTEDPRDVEPIIFLSETGFANGGAGMASSWVEGLSDNDW